MANTLAKLQTFVTVAGTTLALSVISPNLTPVLSGKVPQLEQRASAEGVSAKTIVQRAINLSKQLRVPIYIKSSNPENIKLYEKYIQGKNQGTDARCFGGSQNGVATGTDNYDGLTGTGIFGVFTSCFYSVHESVLAKENPARDLQINDTENYNFVVNNMTSYYFTDAQVYRLADKLVRLIEKTKGQQKLVVYLPKFKKELLQSRIEQALRDTKTPWLTISMLEFTDSSMIAEVINASLGSAVQTRGENGGELIVSPPALLNY